ncbi:MAG: hypothetical protein K2U26_12075 [Cyclobacteriaceae bacterium]|nr:hypothetical protein [Cyclobacteriaceae bacterium]
MSRKLAVWVFFSCITMGAFAQQGVRVRGHFESDSISIGSVVPFSLTARYPQNRQVLFPDSTFSFKPFEINGKVFFPTKTTNGISYDSVVYLLTTFEIDSVQSLKLPVFDVVQKDCVAVYSPLDSIYFSNRVAHVPDSVSAEKLPLKTNTAYQSVQWLFDYPVYSIIGAILIVVILIVYLIFGKQIRKYFALKRLKKDYMEFMERFNRSVEKLSQGFTSRKAEETLLVWKNYMENLEKHPYTKFTSREILRLANDASLESALRSIDRGIYGGIQSPVDSFQLLQAFSQQRFNKKETEVRNG